MKRELLEIMLYDDQRIKKITLMIKGFWDYKKNKFGKYAYTSSRQ